MLKILCYAEHRHDSINRVKLNHNQKFKILRKTRKILQNKINQDHFKKSKTKARTLGKYFALGDG